MGSYHYDYTGAVTSGGDPERKINDQSRAIEDVTLTVEKLKITLTAMWEIMEEQGVDKQTLYTKIENVIKKDLEDPYAVDFRICPKCGRKVTEQAKTPMRGNCLFCGESMMFFPFDDESREKAQLQEIEKNNPEPVQEAEPYDPLKDLGF